MRRGVREPRGRRGPGGVHRHLRRSRESGNPEGAGRHLRRSREGGNPEGAGRHLRRSREGGNPEGAGRHLRRSREGGNPGGVGRWPHPPTPPSFPRRREPRGRGATATCPSFQQRSRMRRGAREPKGRGAPAALPSFPRRSRMRRGAREPRGARGAGGTSVVPAKAGTQGGTGRRRHLRRSRESGNPGGARPSGEKDRTVEPSRGIPLRIPEPVEREWRRWNKGQPTVGRSTATTAVRRRWLRFAMESWSSRTAGTGQGTSRLCRSRIERLAKSGVRSEE